MNRDNEFIVGCRFCCLHFYIRDWFYRGKERCPNCGMFWDGAKPLSVYLKEGVEEYERPDPPDAHICGFS